MATSWHALISNKLITVKNMVDAEFWESFLAVFRIFSLVVVQFNVIILTGFHKKVHKSANHPRDSSWIGSPRAIIYHLRSSQVFWLSFAATKPIPAFGRVSPYFNRPVASGPQLVQHSPSGVFFKGDIPKSSVNEGDVRSPRESGKNHWIWIINLLKGNHGYIIVQDGFFLGL